MDVDENGNVILRRRDVCGICGRSQSELDRLRELENLARRVAEMSGGPYALEALLDLREWFGMDREVPTDD